MLIFLNSIWLFPLLWVLCFLNHFFNGFDGLGVELIIKLLFLLFFFHSSGINFFIKVCNELLKGLMVGQWELFPILENKLQFFYPIFIPQAHQTRKITLFYMIYQLLKFLRLTLWKVLKRISVIDQSQQTLLKILFRT